MRLSPEELEEMITPYGFKKTGVTDLGYNYLIQFSKEIQDKEEVPHTGFLQQPRLGRGLEKHDARKPGGSRGLGLRVVLRERRGGE
jgi:hypothetical protein